MSFFNKIPTVSVMEAFEHAQHDGVVFVDVRNPDEYARGHAAGARNCPLPTFAPCLDKLHSATEVYVICQSGGRSARATEMLREGGVHAFSVAGGTLQWRASGLPMA